jgi:hypothetical protein
MNRAQFEDGVCSMRCAPTIAYYILQHISPRVTIGALPDNVLLDIFEFCRLDFEHSWGEWAKTWYKLVHVCQRWRYVIFASPNSLDLCLFCTATTHAKETFDVWPSFPIEISADVVSFEDNIIAAL